MDTPYAFVTLVTSDHYLPGALAVAAALKDQHASHPPSPEVAFQTLCLVTPESVDVSTIKLLRRAFDIVIGVEIIEQEDGAGLQLLGESRGSVSFSGPMCGTMIRRRVCLCEDKTCTSLPQPIAIIHIIFSSIQTLAPKVYSCMSRNHRSTTIPNETLRLNILLRISTSRSPRP